MSYIWEWTNHTLAIFAITGAASAFAAVQRLKDEIRGREASFDSVTATLASLACLAWFIWTVA